MAKKSKINTDWIWKSIVIVVGILIVLAVVFTIIQSVNGGRPLSPGFTSEVVSTVETLSSSA